MGTARRTASGSVESPPPNTWLPPLRRDRLVEPECVGAHTWLTTDGRALYGRRDLATFWLWSPDAATFRFEASGPVSFVGDDSVAATLWRRSALPLALEARGLSVVHASALVGASGCVVVCGRSASGKSTLAASIDAEVVADDAIAFVAEASSVIALTLPFELRPRPGCSPLRPAAGAGGKRFPIRHVVLLDPDPTAADVALSPLTAATALGELMPHAYCFSLTDSRERLVSAYGDLASAVPVHRLTYRREAGHLPAMAATIEALLRD